MTRSGSLLSIIAGSLPEPVLIFSPEGRLEALNGAAMALTGVEAGAAAPPARSPSPSCWTTRRRRKPC